MHFESISINSIIGLDDQGQIRCKYGKVQIHIQHMMESCCITSHIIMGLTGTVNQIISSEWRRLWCFGSTSLRKLAKICSICGWSVLLLCLAIQSVPETPNLLFVYFGLSLQAAKEQAIHFILYHILYYI